MKSWLRNELKEELIEYIFDRKFYGDNIKADKNIRTKMRDSRYAHKNRRTVNKDWKDFNNMQ